MFLVSIILSGNRMPLLLFLFSIFLVILFEKKIRKYIFSIVTTVFVIFIIAYLSNKQIKTDWTRQKNLSPGTYSQNFISADGSLNHKVIHSISEGPSDFLSKITSKLLGNRVIDNKPIATLVQYNSIYAKIGIVTIIMSLFVILISPFIKKLMHGIH